MYSQALTTYGYAVACSGYQEFLVDLPPDRMLHADKFETLALVLIYRTAVQVHPFMDRPECWCHPHQQIRPGVLWLFVPSRFDALPYGILLHPGVHIGTAQGGGRCSIG